MNRDLFVDPPAPRRPRSQRGRFPLQAMTGTQAKLVGGAIATILVWLWGRYSATADEIPGEVGAQLGVLLVALVDLTLGGKPET